MAIGDAYSRNDVCNHDLTQHGRNKKGIGLVVGGGRDCGGRANAHK